MTIVEATQAGFAKLEALFSSKSSLEADLAKARNENTELQATLKRQEQEIQNLKATGQAATDRAAADAKQITDLTAAMASRDAEIAALKAGAKSAGQQAAEMLSAAAIPAGQLPAANPNRETIDSLRAKLNSKTLTPVERANIALQLRELRGHADLFKPAAE